MKSAYSLPASAIAALCLAASPAQAQDATAQSTAEELAAMRARLVQWLPTANGPLQRSVVCTYTNTRDGHFVIDTHPASDRCWIVSPCSGHGFKFASAIGARIAAWVSGDASASLPGRFRLSRLERS